MTEQEIAVIFRDAAAATGFPSSVKVTFDRKWNKLCIVLRPDFDPRWTYRMIDPIGDTETNPLVDFDLKRFSVSYTVACNAEYKCWKSIRDYKDTG